MNNKAAKWVYLILAIMCVAIAFDYSRKVGAAILIAAVLGVTLTAQKRGALRLAGG